MFSQEDLNYLEWVVNSSDDNRAWDIWQTLKPAVLAQQTTNQQSTPPCAGCNHVPTVECLSSRLRTGNC
jgi:hypothetical protein